MGEGEGWIVRCFVPLMHFCIGKCQSVPRFLARIVAPAAVEDLRFIPLVYGLCMLRFKDFVQSWRQLSINPCSFAGKELEVNG